MSKSITTNRRCHQRLCLEAWHINSAHAPLNRDDGGLLPDAYLHLVRKKTKSSTSFLRPVGLKKERLNPQRMWDISMPLAGWMVVKEERLIQYGQWRFKISRDQWLIKVNQFSTIWRTARSEDSLEKSSSQFFLELSCLQKEFVEKKWYASRVTSPLQLPNAIKMAQAVCGTVP